MTTSRVRVVVAIDASPASLQTLRASVELAVRLRGEMHGLFVEDPDLRRWATLPFTREVVTLSPRPRAIHARELERQLRRQATRARAALEQAARTSGIEATFQIVRGTAVADALVSAIEPGGFLAVGRRARAPSGRTGIGPTIRRVLQRSTGRVVMFPERPAATAPVAAVVTSAADCSSVLNTAFDLSSALDQPLTAYCVGDDLAKTSSLEVSVNEVAQSRGGQLACHQLVDAQWSRRLPALLAVQHCGTLVVPGTLPAEGVEGLLRDFTGTVVIVGARRS